MTEVVPGTLALRGAAETMAFFSAEVHLYFSGKSHFTFSGDGTFPTPLRRCHQNEPRPVESKTPVHRARYCGLFAAVGTLKMPSGTLLRENRGRWAAFYMSTGRGYTGCPASA